MRVSLPHKRGPRLAWRRVASKRTAHFLLEVLFLGKGVGVNVALIPCALPDEGDLLEELARRAVGPVGERHFDRVSETKVAGNSAVHEPGCNVALHYVLIHLAKQVQLALILPRGDDLPDRNAGVLDLERKPLHRVGIDHLVDVALCQEEPVVRAAIAALWVRGTPNQHEVPSPQTPILFSENSCFYPLNTKKRRIKTPERFAGMDTSATEALESPPVLSRDSCNVRAYVEEQSLRSASADSVGSIEPYRLEDDEDLEFQDAEGEGAPLLSASWIRSVMKRVLCLCGFDLFASAKG